MAESAFTTAVDMAKFDILKEFKTITMAEEPTAIQYLDQHQWDITEALNSYFSSSQLGVDECGMYGIGTKSNPIVIDSSFISNNIGASSVQDDGEQSAEVENLTLLTWNIDGLSEKQRVERTRYICEVINLRKPDVVFLQEVVDETLFTFHRRCKGYTILSGKNALQLPYFTSIMLRDQTIKQVGPLEEIFFQKTTMGRHLLMQPAMYNQQVKVVLITSHLESTAQPACKQERQRQLGIVLDKMLSQNPECTVIFGGDTNLRDIEVKQVGIPDEILDAWESCGKAEKTKFTWDTSVNDNLDWPYPKKSKLRFDRVYVHSGQNNSCLESLEFSLIGKERLASGVFPSDHWGIWCRFGRKTAKNK